MNSIFCVQIGEPALLSVSQRSLEEEIPLLVKKGACMSPGLSWNSLSIASHLMWIDVVLNYF